MLKVGIIGAGGVAHVHAGPWQRLGARVSVTSTSGAERFATEYGFQAAPNLDALLDAVDLVDILTPTPSHETLALRAIEHGCHVICEKPLALTAASGARMGQAAAQRGVRLFPAHVVRYMAAYHDLKNRINAGQVGAVRRLRLQRFVAAPSSPWFFSEPAGGGIIRDLMIHDIDQALWFAGPVTTVSATQDPPSANGEVTVPVTAQVTLSHRGGATSDIQAKWMPVGAPFISRAEIIGSEGELHHDNQAESLPDTAPDTEAANAPGYLPPVAGDSEDPYYTQLADFITAIDQRRDARVTAADAIAAVAVTEAAYTSLTTGTPVPVTP